MKKLIAIAIAGLLVLSIGCAKSEPTSEETGSETTVSNEPEVVEETTEEVADAGVKEGPFEGMRAPDFTLNDLEGNEVTLSSLKGQSVALIYWTTW